MQQPLFMQYHDHMPFNENMLQPCPMLEKTKGRKAKIIVEREKILKIKGLPHFYRGSPFGQSEYIGK